MRYTLESDSRHSYSKAEHRVWTLLASGKKIKSTDLTKRYYNGRVPLNGQVCVMAIIRKLSLKMKANKSKRSIMRSGRQGPNPIQIWVE